MGRIGCSEPFCYRFCPQKRIFCRNRSTTVTLECLSSYASLGGVPAGGVDCLRFRKKGYQRCRCCTGRLPQSPGDRFLKKKVLVVVGDAQPRWLRTGCSPRPAAGGRWPVAGGKRARIQRGVRGVRGIKLSIAQLVRHRSEWVANQVPEPMARSWRRALSDRLSLDCSPPRKGLPAG